MGNLKSDEELWDNYSNRFNLLSDKLDSSRVDVKELIDLLESYENLPPKYKSAVHQVHTTTKITTARQVYL